MAATNAGGGHCCTVLKTAWGDPPAGRTEAAADAMASEDGPRGDGCADDPYTGSGRSRPAETTEAANGIDWHPSPPTSDPTARGEWAAGGTPMPTER